MIIIMSYFIQSVSLSFLKKMVSHSSSYDYDTHNYLSQAFDSFVLEKYYFKCIGCMSNLTNN